MMEKIHKHEELPLYKLVNELAVEFLQCSKDVPRVYRYELVEEACKQLVEVLSYLYLAATTSDKLEKRQNLMLSKHLMAKVVIELRLLHELSAIGNKRFILLAQKADEIGKQLFKWTKTLTEHVS